MYKKNNSFEKRVEESKNILLKYPNKIPVIVERYTHCRDIDTFDKQKFLIPDDMSMNQFIYIIRKRLKLTPTKALFVFINNKLVPNSNLISKIYLEEKEEDNFLYIQYSSENTFG
jgi:GABA(A) receptor-associated protein